MEIYNQEDVATDDAEGVEETSTAGAPAEEGEGTEDGEE